MKNQRKLTVFFLMVTILTSVLLILGSSSEVKAELVYLNYSACEMTAGKHVQLQVIGTSEKVVWKSSNKKVAKVNNGKVTGIKKGKCTITAHVNGQKFKCKVTITGGEIVTEFKKPTLDVLSLKIDMHRIDYTKEGKSLLTDEPDTFKLKLLNKPAGKIKWSSTDEAIATVTKGTVTAVSKGKCTIVAKVKKKKYKCKVVVTDHNDPVKIEKQENIYLMLQLLNRDRVKVKSKPLKIKKKLNKLADIRVLEISKKFSHTRPDGTEYSTVYEETGIEKGTAIGENLSHFSDGVKGMNALVSKSYESLFISEMHKDIMINPIYSCIGLSYYNADVQIGERAPLFVDVYWAQEFYTE